MQIFLQENAKYCTFLRPNRKKYTCCKKMMAICCKYQNFFVLLCAENENALFTL